MKKKCFATLLSVTIISTLGTGATRADFISPSISSTEMEMPAAEPAPPSLLGARTWFVINPHDGGPGSLRDLIDRASAGDRIRFWLRCPTTLVVTNTLVISKDLAILGPGPECLTVMRSEDTNTPSFRLFNVQTGLVTLAGMTMRNGRALNTSGTNSNLGGAILNRGGSLTVKDCVITQNVAPTEFGGQGFGGGIFSIGSLRVEDSTISDNEATAAGGGIATFHSPELVVRRSTVSGNFAGIQGGGVNFQGVTGLIRNSTISGNSTVGEGIASGLLTLCFGNEGALLNVTACTVTRNFGTTNGAFVLAALTGNLGTTNLLLDTLVADNEGANFHQDGNPVLQSLGHNLDGDGTSGLVNGTNGDLVGSANAPIDPRLSPLQDNGGPTLTHSLLVGSPALDQGAALDAEGEPIVNDQRGFPRPQGPASDIGAVENQPPRVVCCIPHRIELSSSHGAVADLKVFVFDPDGDALSVVWSVDGTPFRTNLVAATHPPEGTVLTARPTLTNGYHVITVSVWDGKAAPQECSTRVKVEDHTPPKIHSVTASPRVLSPADHELKTVNVTVVASDASGEVRSRIVSVKSNEPQGGNAPDWVITGDLTVQLRAERSDHGFGRVYTITVRCSDVNGNSRQATTRVSVPR